MLPPHLMLNVELKFPLGCEIILFLVVGPHEEMCPSCIHTTALSSLMHPRLSVRPHEIQSQKSGLGAKTFRSLTTNDKGQVKEAC